MNRIIVFLVALFFTASAFAQTCYDPDEDMYYNCGDDSSYYYPDNGVAFGFFLPFGGYNNGGYYHHGGGYYHGGGYHGGGYHGGGYHGGGGHHH